MPGVAAHHAQEPRRPLIGRPVVAVHPGVLNLGQPRYTPRGCGCCAPRPWFSMLFLGRYALRCDAVMSLVAVRRAAGLLVGAVAARRLVTWRVCVM